MTVHRQTLFKYVHHGHASQYFPLTFYPSLSLSQKQRLCHPFMICCYSEPTVKNVSVVMVTQVYIGLQMKLTWCFFCCRYVPLQYIPEQWEFCNHRQRC